ncbi:MAG: pilus assembly protein PilM, partial [Candidatus Lindowbacteria bacterium]|nr:pilus assembly protein PilM [Candidatus Lindowbacteria bacterium]
MILETKSVGIDIQPDSVKIAVASAQGGRTKVLRLISKPIPEAADQETKAVTASIIKEAFEENGLNGDTCVTALPAAASINRVLTSPVTAPAKIRQTLKFQIEPQIPFPVDQIISDYVLIRKSDDGAECLAIAVNKSLISDKLEVLKLAGVEPNILTLDALALADFYTDPFDFSPDKVTVLLHAGRKSSFLGFFNGEKLVAYRSLDGLSEDNEDAVRKMAREIQRSIIAFQPPAGVDAEIGTLCIAGTGTELLTGFLQDMFRELPVKAVEFNRRVLAEIPPPLMNEAEGCHLAIALARVGLEGSANAVNFRQEEYAPLSLFTRLKKNILFSVALLAVAAAAWFGSVLAQVRDQSHQMKALNEDMLKIFATSLPGVKSPAAAEQKIKQEQQRFKHLGAYSSNYVSPLNVLAEVQAGVPPQKNLELKDMAVSDNVLRMTGE